MTRNPCAVRVICWLAAAQDGIDHHPATESPNDCETYATDKYFLDVVKLAANCP